MRLTATSPMWIWCALVLVVLFVVWAASLMVSVNGKQEHLTESVQILNHLGRLERDLRELNRKFIIYRQNRETLSYRADWQHLYADYRSYYEVLHYHESTVAGIQRYLGRIHPHVQNMDSLHTVILTSSGDANLAPAESSLHATMRRAMDEVKVSIRTVREEQEQTSQSLTATWRQLYALAILACLLVIALTILLNTYQRELIKRKKTEQTLRESEERFRRLAESASVIPWEANLHTFQFNYVGPRAVELLGYPVAAWYEPDFWPQHLHPEDREYAANFCREAAACQTDFELEYRMIAKDGRTIWLRDYVSVISGENGPSLLRGFLFDITTRKQIEEALRESEEGFRIVFHQSPDGIMLINPHDPQVAWPIVACNEAACRMNGYLGSELIGQPFDILNPLGSEQQDRAKNLETLQRQGTVQLQGINRRKDGSLFPVEISASLIKLNGQEFIVGIERDVSERQQSEKAVLT